MAVHTKLALLPLIVLALTLFGISTTGAYQVFKLSEMKHVGDHCESPPDAEEGKCNFFSEPTKSCRNNRCSCREEFMEVSFFGYLECVVPGGKPCLSSLWFTNLMSRDEFKMTIMNFTVLEQRRELAVYDVFQEHIEASKSYAYDKTPKDMSCASGMCGETDVCLPGVNKIFNQKIESSYGVAAILGIVFAVIVTLVLLCGCCFGLMVLYYRNQGQIGIPWGFRVL